MATGQRTKLSWLRSISKMKHRPKADRPLDENYKYSDFAILVRANDHAIPFQRALERQKIPSQF